MDSFLKSALEDSIANYESQKTRTNIIVSKWRLLSGASSSASESEMFLFLQYQSSRVKNLNDRIQNIIKHNPVMSENPKSEVISDSDSVMITNSMLSCSDNIEQCRKPIHAMQYGLRHIPLVSHPALTFDDSSIEISNEVEKKQLVLVPERNELQLIEARDKPLNSLTERIKKVGMHCC